MKKGGRASAMMSKPVEGPKNAPMPKGGEVKFGMKTTGRKGRKA